MTHIDAKTVALGLLAAGILLGAVALVSSYDDLYGGATSVHRNSTRQHSELSADTNPGA